jgi:acetolactate synthase regulatory subunit
MTDDGHQIAVAARFRPENAEAVLRVVEGDPLHKARENFLSR